MLLNDLNQAVLLFVQIANYVYLACQAYTNIIALLLISSFHVIPVQIIYEKTPLNPLIHSCSYIAALLLVH